MSRIYGFDLIYKAVGFYPSEWDRVTVQIGTNLALVVFAWVSLKIGSQAMVWRQSEREKFDRRMWVKHFWIIAVPLGSIAIYALL